MTTKKMYCFRCGAEIPKKIKRKKNNGEIKGRCPSCKRIAFFVDSTELKKQDGIDEWLGDTTTPSTPSTISTTTTTTTTSTRTGYSYLIKGLLQKERKPFNCIGRGVNNGVFYIGTILDQEKNTKDLSSDWEFRFLTTTVEGEKISFPSEIYVSKILINEEELEKYHLPKRFDVPAKKGNNVYNKIKADPRARGFYKKYRELFQVEIEALSPKILVDTLEEHLLKYVDIKKMEQVQKLEKQDINRINQLIQEDGEF
jgi:hypothetical protein